MATLSVWCYMGILQPVNLEVKIWNMKRVYYKIDTQVKES